jgi:hypothetical protein
MNARIQISRSPKYTRRRCRDLLGLAASAGGICRADTETKPRQKPVAFAFSGPALLAAGPPVADLTLGGDRPIGADVAQNRKAGRAPPTRPRFGFPGRERQP